MMKKKLNFIVAFLLMVCFLASCMGENPPDVGTIDTKAEIWVAENTEKILLDYDYTVTDKQNKQVKMESAKNEYENAQFIITAKQNIDNVQVEAGNFVSSGGAVIAKENINVYYQKYVEITSMSSPNAPTKFGMHPDALVPIEAIRTKGEAKITEGNNQGIWFTLYVPKDAAAGEYTSQFKVVLDGAEGTVDVSLKVFNFSIPDENHFKSSFWQPKEWLMAGELDNSDEIMEKYYEQLLDYRMMVNNLPVFTYNVDDWIDSLKKYTAMPATSAINLYMEYESRTVTYEETTKFIKDYNYDVFNEMLHKMAEQSTPELNLFSKVYYTDNSIDEPEGTNNIFEANYKSYMFDKTLADFVDELDAENFDYQAHGITVDDILGIEFVVTNRYMDVLSDLRNYCPLMNRFTTEEDRAFYENLRETREYSTTWWYIAWDPQYPYANYRVEESSVGSRVLPWMQKDYGIEGFLYWGTSVYASIGVGAGFTAEPRDPYVNPIPLPFNGIAYDGQLTYPGRPYGIYGFVPSIRLESIRDGIEDYEYLYLLEELIGQANDDYSTSFDFDEIIDSVYALLYEGIIPNADGEKLRHARREVAAMIELLNSEISAITLIGTPDAKTNTASIEIYATDVVTLKINGAAVESKTDLGEGRSMYTYTYQLTDTQNYAEIEFVTSNTSYTIIKYVGQRTNNIELIKDGASTFVASKGHALDEKEHITLSKSGDATKPLKIEIAKYETTNPVALALYKPAVSLLSGTNLDGVSFADMDSFSFVIDNKNGSNRKITITLYDGNDEKVILTKTLSAGENVVTVNDISLIGWSRLATANKLSLVFENAADGSDVYYIGNMYYTVK